MEILDITSSALFSKILTFIFFMYIQWISTFEMNAFSGAVLCLNSPVSVIKVTLESEGIY